MYAKLACNHLGKVELCVKYGSMDIFYNLSHFVFLLPTFCPTQEYLLRFLCRNPNLGLATKTKACKVVGQEGSPGITSYDPRSAKECEGVNPHTPKWTPSLGVGVLKGLLNLQREIVGVKTHQFEKFFILSKSYWNVDV
jgi:hypothetical protein